MSFISLFLKGILIGSAMMMPGVSGGVIAVIFNVYDQMIFSLYNIFKNFKKNFIFLFILSCGVFTGAIFFSKIILFFYVNYEVLTKFLFIGLIIGSIPCLMKNVREKTNKNINYIITIIFFIISFFIFVLTKKVFNINFSNNLTFINLFLSGFIYSIGKVIPGISSSLLLMLIGMYEFVLKIIANPFVYLKSNFNIVMYFLIGLIIGIILLLIIVNKLLNNSYRLMYSAIIGFIIGQIPSLIPHNSFNVYYFLGLLIMMISTFMSYRISKK